MNLYFFIIYFFFISFVYGVNIPNDNFNCQSTLVGCSGLCPEGQSCIKGALGECQCEARISEPTQTSKPVIPFPIKPKPEPANPNPAPYDPVKPNPVPYEPKPLPKIPEPIPE
ncbi:hypothetical protein C2G38_2251809 [Gigaspora rosea]|uniref:Uncharacterized protein n=1 Tax=Gigaspora rosea TaxID=44941 RepID=A0A397UJ12_9GLOM|nr:hypothetical protein C2G38_2251809 [Gigaspora rosea]